MNTRHLLVDEETTLELYKKMAEALIEKAEQHEDWALGYQQSANENPDSATIYEALWVAHVESYRALVVLGEALILAEKAKTFALVGIAGKVRILWMIDTIKGNTTRVEDIFDAVDVLIDEWCEKA